MPVCGSSNLAPGTDPVPGAIQARAWSFQADQKHPISHTSPAHAAQRRPHCPDFCPYYPFSATLQLSNFVILAVRQPEPRTVSCPPVYQILWVRGFRAHTIPGRGFNLFKPLRRHFRATPFCRQAPLAPRPQRPPLGSYATFRSNTCVFRRTFRGCLYDFNWL